MRDSWSGKGDSQSAAHHPHENAGDNERKADVRGTNCFVNHRSEFDSPGRLSGGTAANSEGGPAGTPAETVRTIALEDRLYAAIARRGDLRIAQFINEAFVYAHRTFPGHFYQEADAVLVAACEEYADRIARDESAR